MTDKQVPDWERIEQLYRAGVLSVREIAASQGITHGAINKRAKRDGWDRDLQAKIQAKADSLVSKAAVSTLVSTETRVAERIEVAANAQVVAGIRLDHRTDIGRARRLVNKMLDELESLTDSRGDIADLIEQLKEAEDGSEAMLELANKMSSLPTRTKTMRELSETLKNLITLERQAYSLDTGDGKDPDPASRQKERATDPIEAARIYQDMMSGD